MAERTRARIPAGVVFQEKWRPALMLLRHVYPAGFAITAVLGDAEFGGVTARRQPASAQAAITQRFLVSRTLTA
jgi:hypothetical protein